MKRLLTTLMLLFAVAGFALAQRTVVGTVSGDDGEGLVGATVKVKGTSAGTLTDVSGRYSIKVPNGSNTLVFSYTGYATQEVTLGASNVVEVVLVGTSINLGETVVTALGVARYKNELPYSAQKVEGGDVSNVRNTNVVNSLSGKVAGLEVKRNNSLGGSTNIVLRGVKSLTNDNQALFVIDGVPIDNSNTNTANQRSGRAGYDYGNAAGDINPDDVESVTVLKGAAASALYGSRASNGVVMITTKKGSKKKGIGVSLNIGANMGKYDKTTFIEYQDKYGAGYGAYYEDPTGFFLYRDINEDGTDDLVATTSEDASWGAPFDPNVQVYQWDAFDPTSPNFGKTRPWVAAANGPGSFFETSVGTNNSVVIDGSNDKGYFKLGYTHATDKGILPNSRVNKDVINFGAAFDLTDRIQAFSSVNFTATDGLGRYGTGYDSKNLMTNYRQWWQTNVDLQDQRDAYDRTGANVTWNWADPSDLTPIYWDNPYFTRFENYQNDHRNRYFGYTGLNVKLANWLNMTARVSLDQYDEVQEERIAVGSVDPSLYQRYNRNYRELNYDLMFAIPQMEILNNLNFDALVGGNIRRNTVSSILASTNGGLVIPQLYSLSNSKNPINAPTERFTDFEVDGIYAKAGFVYDRWAILDLTIRRDQSSTLPTDNNAYIYPSASLGIIFSHWLPADGFVTFGKVRANYAEVSNTANPLSVFDVYNLGTGFGDATIASVPTTKNNDQLKPEFTESLEAGIEMRFAKDMFGFDVTAYKQTTTDQIIPVATSRATGFSAKYINTGTVENKGVEVSAFIRPVNTANWTWRVEANWARNRNKVTKLNDGIDNLLLASFQGGVSINATLDEPYGTIRGSNWTFLDGQKVVNANGYYQNSATSNEIIGNVNPDWIGGVYNSVRYKNITLGFLVDMKQGGDIFSLDLYYGLATGLYPETAGNNDLGNPVRSSLADGGGLIIPGVLADGSPNTKRYDATNFGIYGYRRNPAAAFIYDASFVKLREINLTLDFPKSWMSGNVLTGASLGVYARNPWIISKNTPYSDPEEGFSSGNVQGYQGGAYPSVKTFGVNLNLKF